MNIVLLNPEIPYNTGNIGRTCVLTNTTLHLIKPLGFSIDEKSVRRAGLDYWKDVKIVMWENLDEFLEANKDKNIYFATTKTNQKYSDVNYGENDFVDGVDLIDASREHFVREMFALINGLAISNQPIRRVFEGLLKYVQYCDSNSKLELLSQRGFIEYSLNIKDRFASGDISLGAARVERGNLYALYKEIYDSQRLYALRREVGNFKYREGDESKGHNTLADGEFSKIGKKMLYAYKELAKHLIDDSTPKIYPLFNKDEFVKLGRSNEEIQDIEKIFIKMVSTGNWVNGLSKLSLMILSMWTGANLTVLSRLKKSDISFNKLNGDHYTLKSIKSRAGYKEVTLSIGFTKRTKEFIENWILLSNKINQDHDAPLFPVYKRNGELDEFGLKYPQRQFNVVLDYFNLPNINTSVFRKTRSNIMYRAYEDIFLVADANKSEPETVSRAYLHGVSEVNQMAVTGALEAKMLLVKGTDKATAIEQATYKIKDPLTEKEWQEKGIRQRNRGIVRRESWKQEGGFFKKGNMVDGNVVKDYT